MSGGLIGNIGGMSGADFSPYQRELERRSQLVIEDMRRRQEEARLALEKDLGLRNAKLNETREERMAREGERSAEIAIRGQDITKGEGEANRQHDTEMSKTQEQWQRDAEARGEDRQVRGEQRKMKREDDLIKQAKEEEQAKAAESAKIGATLARITDVVAGLSPEAAMARAMDMLDGTDLTPEQKSRVLERLPEAVRTEHNYRKTNEQVEQAIASGRIKQEDAEDVRNVARGEREIAVGDPDENPDIGQARNVRRMIDDIDLQIGDLERQYQELSRAAGAAVPATGTGLRQPGGSIDVMVPGEEQTRALADQIIELKTRRKELQDSLTALKFKIGREARQVSQ